MKVRLVVIDKLYTFYKQRIKNQTKEKKEKEKNRRMTGKWTLNRLEYSFINHFKVVISHKSWLAEEEVGGAWR